MCVCVCVCVCVWRGVRRMIDFGTRVRIMMVNILETPRGRGASC